MTTLYRMSSIRGRWLFIAFMLLTLSTSAKSEQDSARVTINETNISVEAALLKVEAQTGFTVFYAKQHLNGSDILSKVAIRNVSISDALTVILNGKGVTWKINAGGVTIIKMHENAKPQKHQPADTLLPTIRGTVTSDEGVPMPGATVQVKGTSIGTLTNMDGQFRLEGVPSRSILVVSYTGYLSGQYIAKNANLSTFILKRDVGTLDETIVIGYGSTSKRFNTGAVSKISSEEIARQPVSNPLSTLQGRASGVFIATQNGMPGGNIKVQIRGQGSIAAGTTPLYIVDGVPFNNTSLNTVNSDFVNISGPISPLSIIPTSDIESIEILKDADATAIYGSRGASGVILITTKKAKAGKLSFDVNLYTGVSKTANFANFLSLKDFLALRREGFANDNSIPTSANAPDLLVWDTTKGTDWQKFMLGGSAPVTNVNATLAGGSNNTKFYFGVNHRAEGTVLPGNMSYKRTGGRLNLEHSDSRNIFHVNLGIVYTKDISNIIKSVDAVGIIGNPPNYPAYNPDGSLNWTFPTNPYAWLRQKADNKTSNLNLNGAFRYAVLPGLNLRANLGYSEVDMEMMATLPASSQWPLFQQPLNSAFFGSSKVTNQLMEPQIEYSDKLGDHNIKVLVGGTYQVTQKKGMSIKGTNYANELQLESLSDAGSIEYKFSESSQYRYVSVFSRFNYIYNKRYLLSATFRRDGSTKFGSNKRYGNFGAVSGGWIISDETFFKPIQSAVSYAKIRASYGVTGNDQIPDYLYLPTYSAGQSYQNNVVLQPSLIANPDYSWETNKKFEVALEFALFRDRILSTVAFYRNRSSNQLVQYAVPFVSGFGSYQANLPATVENKGLEFDITSTNILRKSLTWTSAFNLSIPRNKLVEFPNIASSSYANTYVVGQDLSIVKKIRYLGVDPQTGLYSFEDQDKDGKLSVPNDLVVAGRTSPYFFGGLANTVTWGNWQLDVHFQFIKQHSLDNIVFNDASPNMYTNKYTSVLNRWTAPGQVTDFQKPTSSFTSEAGRLISTLAMSDRQLINTSYIRLRNVSFSYRLPQSWLNRVKISNVRFFVEGQNLWTYATTKGIDPETINGLSLTVPALKTFVGGFQLSL